VGGSQSFGQDAAPLTLSQAVKIALEKNPLRKAAIADQHAAGAGVKEARSGLWPRLMFSESAMRGDDPVYAFGTRLRQGRFTAADFALNRLNSPTPIGNFATKFSGQWTLFNSFANYFGIKQAEHMNEAANQQLARTDQETEFRAISAYHALLLALKQKQLAEQALQTAQSIADQAKARYESGLVVESDYLSAQVNLASRRQEAIEANNAVALARAVLNNALGVAAESYYEPAEVLAERKLPENTLADAEKTALERRPDLKQVMAQEAASATGVKMAKAAFGPRLNAFAGWELDNPTLFAGGGSNNWVAGAELQFDLFQGGAKMAQLSRSKAMEEKLAALHQVASDGVRLDVRKAFYDYDAARQSLDVTRASVAQAEESMRINQNRYQGGLTTITDMLRAEEALRRSRTDYWQSVYRYQTSYANLELATGTLNPQSPVVTQ
jgi:outer membrane protein TolC